METGNPRSGLPEPAVSRLPLGTNQSGMRAHNERLVLSLVRKHGSLAKTDIARLTQLSAQTVSVIMRALEKERLLKREEPVRGKVGQPLVPMSLNPEGAFFLGLKIGRRSAELVLIDFVGTVRRMLHSSYPYPAPLPTIAFAREGIAALRTTLTPEQDRRIAGLGIAMPFELWNWADTIDAPKAIMDGWRHSACGAELVFGRSGDLRDFVYFYIGAFAGGGVVLDGKLHRGQSGNAGALGSMPVPGPDGRPAQLIDVASIAILEQMLAKRGIDSAHLWTSPQDWGDIGPSLDRWIDQAASALAYAIVAASAVIDFQAAVIDGWMPAAVRARLVAAVRRSMAEVDVEGLTMPEVREGTVGIHARALGGASLPLSERFLLGATAPEA